MKWVWFYGQVWKEFKKSRSEKSNGFTVIGYFLFLQKPKSLLFLSANSFQCDIPVSLSTKMHLDFFSWFFGTVLQGMRSVRTLQVSFFFSLTHHVDHTYLNINLDGQFICLGFLRSICNCFFCWGETFAYSNLLRKVFLKQDKYEKAISFFIECWLSCIIKVSISCSGN